MIDIRNNLRDVLGLAILIVGFVSVYKLALDYFKHK